MLMQRLVEEERAAFKDADLSEIQMHVEEGNGTPVEVVSSDRCDILM